VCTVAAASTSAAPVANGPAPVHPAVAAATPTPIGGSGSGAVSPIGSGPSSAPGTGSTLTDPGFTDSFATAVDDAPGYGLNDSLTSRQTGSLGVTYTRTSGLWNSTAAPQAWYSQVNHASYPKVLSFWDGTSAVRMDAPVVANAQNNAVGVQATLDPVTGDTTSPDWSSLVLSRDENDTGYVSNSDVAIGVLVRSNGGIQVFQGGTSLASIANFAKPNADGAFTVTISFRPGVRAATVTVNGVSEAVTTTLGMPSSSWLFMGAYLSSASEVSTVSDLSALAVNTSGLALDASSNLRYYGYYAARLSGDSHLQEVSGRSNLNWVNISDPDDYDPSVLTGCAADGCVVNTGNEFFQCDAQGNNCALYGNYVDRWNILAAEVKPYLNDIAAFYILDEPQWHGATPAAIQTAAQQIKATFPDKKVMMVEAGPEITSSLVIPSAVDWVGFDWYCQPFSTIQQKLATLESITSSSQSLFLLPENAPLSECAGLSGHETDADIAALQWQYFDLAQANPRVIGLMNFGFWTAPAWTSGSGAASLPLTVDADERVAARILAAASG
jgi:hypothetical protein